MEALMAQYAGGDEETRLTRQYIAKMEFDTTMHALSPYLTKGSKVCELGAATGCYSLTFAQMGCDVTAVELVAEQVTMLRNKARDSGLQVNLFHGNACDIPFVEDDSQDLCVILGPLYHLKSIEQRAQAIAEAKRILKPNGTLAVAYISRYFIAGMFAQQFPELISPSMLSELLEVGTVSDELAEQFFQVGYFATPTEMEVELLSAGFAIERHMATDGIGRYIAGSVNRFSTEQYQTWLDYHLKTCEEPTLLGSSNHGLVIAKPL
ncbi:class I SAM-dependent methyltransferase [Vibrio profundum]|uniref:class I SAM-dependent methyltransferase n=1 Tax=Vibrio profundum TaxID=2910247 RepID=UPI003D0B2DCB